MGVWASAGRSAVVSGALGSLTSTVALMVAAKIENRGLLQPTNSTSHWLNGEQASLVTKGDLAHTGVGLATHLAATIFWAVPLQLWVGSRRPVPPIEALGKALAISAVAVVVDYGATPKRFTPGWEMVLSKWSMAAVYVAMAAGLAIGATRLGKPVSSHQRHIG
ncbi:hypothetical protein [Lichenihabitans psoromatis]|uniref:hypothetical protein n=1 Tax=Lichenihabitans psoromatis TaxID=2528642 RepID=UPI00103849D3|nr:hypothetical protein [Lichenihabitans psoromatis]